MARGGYGRVVWLWIRLYGQTKLPQSIALPGGLTASPTHCAQGGHAVTRIVYRPQQSQKRVAVPHSTLPGFTAPTCIVRFYSTVLNFHQLLLYRARRCRALLRN